MAYNQFDNYDSEDLHKPGGLDHFVADNMRNDVEAGKLHFFNKEFNVGPTAAALLDPFVIWATTLIYQKGGTKGREWFTSAAKSFKASDATAAKVGLAGELLVRIGGPVAQFSTEIKTTVKDAYKGMHDLSEQASVLLAANGGNVLTSKFTAIANKRAQVYEEGKRNVIGSVISAVRQAPALIAGYYQFQLDRIQNPELAAASAPEAEKRAIREKYTLMQDRIKAKLDKKNRQPKPQHEAPSFELPKDVREHQMVKPISWVFDADARRSLMHPASESDFKNNIHNMSLLPPAVAFGVNAVRNKFVTENDDKICAWDRIKQLEEYADRKHPDIDKVRSDMKQIFEQQAHDLGRKYELEGKSFEIAVDALSNAVVYQKLPVQSLAEILDNKKVVSFGAKDANFGDVEDITAAVDALKEKYCNKVSEKDFYQKSPFTKKDLLNIFKDLPENEKPLFAMTLPPGMLEKAGVDKQEALHYRDLGKQCFTSELADVTRFLIEKGRDELKDQGVKSKYLDELDALEQNFRRADRTGDGNEYIKQNRQDVSETVRNILASVKKPGQLWKEFIGRNSGSGEDPAPKTVLDHATRESGEETPLRG